MKYSKPSLRERGAGHWQARFRYKEGDKWKTLSRNIDATSRRAASRKAGELHARLEREAELEELGATRVLGDDEAVLSKFLANYVDGLESSGRIERTTAAGYRASVSHICRYLADARVDELTGEMVLRMQERLLEDDGLCADSVAKDHRLLKQEMDWAVETGMVGATPFTKSVRAPKRHRREPNALDDEGRRKLLGTLDGMVDSDLTIGIRLGLSAGLRREVIALA